MMQRQLFRAAIFATGAVYLAMVLWTLPTIAREAGGLLPFDLRPFGYSVEEARAFLAALSEAGREVYLAVQHRLDLMFPGLLALTMGLAFHRLAPRRLALALTAVVVAAAGLDWAENAAVAGLLGQAAPTDAAILAASRLTMLKSLCASVGFAALLVLLVRKVWRR